MNAELALAAGYAAALVLGAFLLEWLSAHTHRRSLRYRTAGFEYHSDHDLWVCPEGTQLWPMEFDRERRLVRYRAKAQICNACPRKADCTDSDDGREVVRALDPWPHSEAGRFHRVISLLMVAAAALVIAAELARNQDPGALALLVALMLAAAFSARWLARDLRRHPANFPEPSPSHGLGLAVSGDGETPESPWPSQRRRGRRLG